MSSGGVHVTVSPDSQVIVFSGNLLKAPPLNRRGRKVNNEYSTGKINLLHNIKAYAIPVQDVKSLYMYLHMYRYMAYCIEQLTSFGHEVEQQRQCMLGKEHFWLSTLLMFYCTYTSLPNT